MARALNTEKRSEFRRDVSIAAVWAFAEATFFFIVADVWLTRIALKNRRNALIACVAATVSAVAGGAAMYGLGMKDGQRMDGYLSAIPGISPPLVQAVRKEIQARGNVALMRGPITGTPYKVYAVEAGAARSGFGGFLAWSVLARLPRFVLLTLVAAAAARRLRKMVPEKTLGYAHAGIWTAFYFGYFVRFGW